MIFTVPFSEHYGVAARTKFFLLNKLSGGLSISWLVMRFDSLSVGRFFLQIGWFPNELLTDIVKLSYTNIIGIDKRKRILEMKEVDKNIQCERQEGPKTRRIFNRSDRKKGEVANKNIQCVRRKGTEMRKMFYRSNRTISEKVD